LAFWCDRHWRQAHNHKAGMTGEFNGRKHDVADNRLMFLGETLDNLNY